MALGWVRPNWPAHSSVHAASTFRGGGVSVEPYQSLNLADYVGDVDASVATNRALATQALQLPSNPFWLDQVHGVRIVDAAKAAPNRQADGAYTKTNQIVCAVLTADCLPVLFCQQQGQIVAAVHAGWRGLLAGVLEQALQAMAVPNEQMLAWLGPAIGPRAFKVGTEVRTNFLDNNPCCEAAFQPISSNHWLADLYLLARYRLAACGVRQIYGGNFCTFYDSKHFFSYRKEGVTGRMASLIWLDHVN